MVKGEARQQTPHRFRYKVVQTPRGTFDVAREAVREIDVRQSTLVVPVDLEVYDPARAKGKGKDGANATVQGNILVKGESTPFEIPVEQGAQGVLAGSPRQGLRPASSTRAATPSGRSIYQAFKAAVDGQAGRSRGPLRQGAATEEPPPDSGEKVYYAGHPASRGG